jgi:hypothetical protein
MVKTLLTAFSLLAFYLPPISQSETLTATGEEAELIMKYGTISHTQCKALDEMQWQFCTSLVKLKENTDRFRGYGGIWECTFHHNYAGHYVNIICRRKGENN